MRILALRILFMRILAVETTTPLGSIGLVDEDGTILERDSGPVTAHSTWLLPALEGLMTEAGLTAGDVDGYAVSAGPGSFTGLRIGLSAVKGLALATGKPVVAVPTLEALAHAVRRCRVLICPILDARKNEVYAALYSRDGDGPLSCRHDERVLSPRALGGEISQRVLFLGTGVELYREVLEEILGKRALFASARFRYPRAAQVGRLGLRRLAQGQIEDPDTLEPRYVRPSEAELKGPAGRRS
jgi:tRNA threonylcarbamoyladenosine biosynthesis protein TsaB